MSGPRLAIFDCDGTLVDSQHLIVGAMTEAFGAVGRPVPPPAAVRHVVGLSLDRAMAELLGEGPHELDEILNLSKAYKAAYGAMRTQGAEEPLYDGIAAAVETLGRQGWLTGVATGKSRRGLEHILDVHGLRAAMPFRRTADDCPGKPHPAMIEELLAETGVAPADAVMIGDTVYDIEMARAAGVWAIGVGWGYHASGLLRDAGAHRVVEAAGEISAVCAALVAGT